MTSKLEEDLLAAGFTPEPVHCDDVAIWTGWRAPVKDTYERYYDLITDAMYAQEDDPPWDRHHPHHQHGVGRHCPVLASLVDEYRSVVAAWRSTSEVPPAPGTR